MLRPHVGEPVNAGNPWGDNNLVSYGGLKVIFSDVPKALKKLCDYCKTYKDQFDEQEVYMLGFASSVSSGLFYQKSNISRDQLKAYSLGVSNRRTEALKMVLVAGLIPNPKCHVPGGLDSLSDAELIAALKNSETNRIKGEFIVSSFGFGTNSEYMVSKGNKDTEKNRRVEIHVAPKQKYKPSGYTVWEDWNEDVTIS